MKTGYVQTVAVLWELAWLTCHDFSPRICGLPTPCISGNVRPLALLWIGLQAGVFGDWLAGYHLVNILLHVLATVLVYAFVGHLLLAGGSQPSVSRLVALLAAVVFGVHTIHTEVVNSIFNSSEMLVTIGVVGGLWWFLRTRGAEPVKAWLGLGLVYLLVLLCRESGASLPALTVVILWLADPDRGGCDCTRIGLLLPTWQLRLAHTRVPRGGRWVGHGAAGTGRSVPRYGCPCAQLPVESGVNPTPQLPAATGADVAPQLQAAAEAEPQRSVGSGNWWASADFSNYRSPFRHWKFLRAVNLWFESLKIMLWPYPLQIYYDKLPSDIWPAAVAQAVVLCFGIVAYIKKRPLLLIGLAFFYLAILPSSSYLGNLEQRRV